VSWMGGDCEGRAAESMYDARWVGSIGWIIIGSRLETSSRELSGTLF